MMQLIKYRWIAICMPILCRILKLKGVTIFKVSGFSVTTKNQALYRFFEETGGAKAPTGLY
jgi:hypothetical protein